jgi:hypothetical protein
VADRLAKAKQRRQLAAWLRAGRGHPVRRGGPPLAQSDPSGPVAGEMAAAVSPGRSSAAPGALLSGPRDSLSVGLLLWWRTATIASLWQPFYNHQGKRP